MLVGGLVTARAIIPSAPVRTLASTTAGQLGLEPIVAHARSGRWSSLPLRAAHSDVNMEAADEPASVVVLDVPRSRLKTSVRDVLP